MNTVKNPYIGPRAFLREDGKLFFGREREERDLLALVVSHRLILFYAQSGAGKSSLVNTRLIPGLEEKDFKVFPLGRVSGDLPSGIVPENLYATNLMRSLVQREVDSNAICKLSLLSFLTGLNEDDEGYFFDSELTLDETRVRVDKLPKCALIVDQFEELFSTHQEEWEKREGFFIQLSQAMEKFSNLWVVLVMREDFIASLDPYAHLLPGGLRTRYYMQRLDREAALSAIKNPVQDLRPYSEGVAEKLVDDLSSISFQKPNKKLGWEPGQYVEPVQLQVVCYSLWENLSPNGRKITNDDRKTVGDVNDALGKYYAKRVKQVAKEKKVKERLIREWFEKELIIGGEIRNLVMQRKDKKKSILDDEVIQALQSDLVRGEKRSGITWYELTHDRLVKPIIENNAEWFNEHLGSLQRRAALWNDHNFDSSWLLLDNDLTAAENWVKENPGELTSLDKSFLKACRREQKQKNAKREAQRRELEMAQKLAEEQARVAQQAKELALVQERSAEQARKHAADQEQSAKKAHRLSRFAFSLLTIALIFGGFAVWGMLSARQNLRKAIESENRKEEALREKEAALLETENLRDIESARELASLASEYQDDQLDRSILIGLQAYRKKGDIPETQSIIISSMQKASQVIGFLTDPQNPATDIEYSPDGKILAVPGEKGIAVWDLDNLESHTFAVPSMSNVYFSPNSESLAVIDNAGIHLWNVQNHMAVTEKPINHHIGAVEQLWFSSDNNLLISQGENDSVNLWQFSNNQYTKINNSIEGTFSNISPDGKTLVVASPDGTLSFWNSATGLPIIERLQGDSTNFSKDGKFVLTIDSKEESFSLWSLDSGEQILESIRGIYPALSPDNQTVAYTNHEGVITLRDINSSEIREFDDLKPATFAEITFGLKGNFLIASSYDKTVVFDLTQKEKGGIVFPDETKPILSQESEVLVTVRESEIIFRNMATGEEFANLQETLIDISPNKKIIISEDFEKNISLWDFTKGTQIGKTIVGNRVIFSPDESVIAVVNKETAEITLQSAATGEVIGVPIALTAEMFSTTDNQFFFIDNQNFAFPGKPGTLNIWNLEDAKVSATCKVSSGSISAIKLSSDKEIVALGSMDGKIIVCRPLINDRAIQELVTNHKGFIENLQFSADSDWMVSSARDGVIAMDATTGEKLFEIPGATFLAFSPDGRSFATKKNDLVSLWNLPDGKKIGTSFEAENIFFDPTGKNIAIQDTEKNILIRSQNTFKPLTLEDIPVERYLEGFSPDGKILATSYSYEYSYDYYNQKYFELWDMETFSPIGAPVNGNVLVFSPDSKKIAVLNLSYGNLVLYDTKNLDQITEFNYSYNTNSYYSFDTNSYYSSSKTEISFSPDSNFMAIKPADTDYGEPYYDPYYGEPYYIYDLQTFSEIPISGEFTAFSPDSKRIAFLNETGSITLWNLEKFSPFGDSLDGHSNEIIHLGLSPNGETLASQAKDGSVILWDATGQWTLGSPIDDKQTNVPSAAISPDGKARAIFSKDDNQIVLESAKTGSETGSLANDHLLGISSTFFSPDDSILAVSSVDGRIFMYEVASGEKIGNTSMEGYIMMFSPDSSVLITSQEDTTTLWNTKNGEKIFEIPSRSVFIGFSPNSKNAFFQNANGEISLVDIRTKVEKRSKITGSYQNISPAGSYIITRENETFSIWDMSSESRVGEPISGYNPIFSQDDKRFIYNYYDYKDYYYSNKWILWDIATQQALREDIPGYSLNFHADGAILTISSYDYTKYVYVTTFIDTATGTTILDGIEGEYPIISPDGSTFLIYSYLDGVYTLWEIESGEKLGTLPSVANYPAYTSDSKLIYALDSNGIKAWGVPMLNLMSSFTAPNSILSPDHRVSATISDEGTLTIRELTSGNVRDREFNLYSGPSKWLSFSPSGNILAIYGSTGVVLWNLSRGEIQTQTPLQERQGIPQEMIFNPEGNLLATLGMDGIIVWNLETNERIAKLQAQSETVRDMSFSQDGNGLIYYTSDGKIYIWDRNNNVTEKTDWLNRADPFCPTALSHDGKYLAYSTSSRLYIGDITTNREIVEPVELNSNCSGAIEFSPSNKYFVYGDADKIYRMELETGNKVEFNETGAFYNIIDMAYIRESDGNDLVAIRSDNGEIHFWNPDKRSFFGEPYPGDFQGLTSNQAIFLFRDANEQVKSINFDPAEFLTLLDDYKKDLCQKVRRNLDEDEWFRYISIDEPREEICDQWP